MTCWWFACERTAKEKEKIYNGKNVSVSIVTVASQVSHNQKEHRKLKEILNLILIVNTAESEFLCGFLMNCAKKRYY